MQQKKTVMPRHAAGVSGTSAHHRRSQRARVRHHRPRRHHRPHAQTSRVHSHLHSAVPLASQQTTLASLDGGAWLVLPLGLALAAGSCRRGLARIAAFRR